MIAHLKKGSFGKTKGRNSQFLKRFKRKHILINKAKGIEVKHSMPQRNDAKYLIQQANIRKGLKAKSSKVIKEAFSYLKKRYYGQNLTGSFNRLINTKRQLVYFRLKKLGSMTYKIPVNLHRSKGIRTLARWISSSVRQNTGKAAINNVIEIIEGIRRGRSNLLRRRSEIHKLGLIGMPYQKYLRRDRMQ